MGFFSNIWKKYINFSRRNILIQGNLDSFSTKTGLKCPKCKSNLYQLSGKSTPQLYICRKCNYQGSLALRR